MRGLCNVLLRVGLVAAVGLVTSAPAAAQTGLATVTGHRLRRSPAAAVPGSP